MLLDLPGDGFYKRVSRQFFEKASFLLVSGIVNTGTILLGAGGVDASAIRTSPAFHPESGCKSDEVPENVPVSP
jgi:hypothetical protein